MPISMDQFDGFTQYLISLSFAFCRFNSLLIESMRMPCRMKNGSLLFYCHQVSRLQMRPGFSSGKSAYNFNVKEKVFNDPSKMGSSKSNSSIDNDIRRLFLVMSVCGLFLFP